MSSEYVSQSILNSQEVEKEAEWSEFKAQIDNNEILDDNYYPFPKDASPSIPIDFELKYEWSGEDLDIQQFLKKSERKLIEFCCLYLEGIISENIREYGYSDEYTLKMKYPNSENPENEHVYYLQSGLTIFKDVLTIREFMNSYFSEELYNYFNVIMFEGWYSGNVYIPPRFIYHEGKLYREGGPRPFSCIMDYNTAKIIDKTDGIIVYACLGKSRAVVEEYEALYGTLESVGDTYKFSNIPFITMYEYHGSLNGDINDISGL